MSVVFTGFERVKDFCPSCKRGERARRMRENYCCQSERGGGRGRESCLRVQRVYVRWHLPLALPRRSYCGELSASLGRSFPLYLCLFFLLFPLSLSLVPFSPPFPACIIFLLALSFSLTMLQDFYRQGRRGALLTEVSWTDGWMDGCTADQSSAAN